MNAIEPLLVDALGVLLGVLISLALYSFRTPNPAGIPVRKIFPRALKGLGLYILFWFSACFIIYEILAQTAGFWNTNWASVLVGLTLPQMPRAKDAFVSLEFARNHPQLVQVMQAVDEETRQYLAKIIDLEEIDSSVIVFETDRIAKERALDKLFEHCIVNIAYASAVKHPEVDVDRLLGISRAGHYSVKFRFLMRHLGYTKFLAALERCRQNPQDLFPAWPVEEGNRRIRDRRLENRGNEPERRGGHPYGRRRIEQPGVRDYIESRGTLEI